MRKVQWQTASAAGAVFAGLMLGAHPAGAWTTYEVFGHYFMVNPIKVCDTDGTNCAVPNYYTSATRKIFKQADTLPVFLPQRTYNSTVVNNQSEGVFEPNYFTPDSIKAASPNTINTWFVNTLITDPGKILYGEAYVGGNAAVYNTTGIAGYSAVGRIDTVAHELAHTLGLNHTTFGAGAANNLVSAGSVRSIPGSVGVIAPDGNFDTMTPEQIDQIHASPFTTDLPYILVTHHRGGRFGFNFNINAGLPGVAINRLRLDGGALGLSFADVSGISAQSRSVAPQNIRITRSTDGSVLELDFGDNDFVAGDELFLDGLFGFTAPADPSGLLLDFDYNIGFGIQTRMEADASTTDPDDYTASSRNVGEVIDWERYGVGDPVPFFNGLTIQAGTIDSDPEPVPEPGTALLLAGGLLGLLGARRRRAA